MKKAILGAAIAAIASTGAFAEDYQFEIGAGYISGDDGGLDYDGFVFNGEFHLDTVDTSKGPLAEAAFLDKSSHIALTYSSTEDDFDGAEAEDTAILSGRYVASGNLIVEASYTDFDGDDTLMGIGVGTYLSDTMDVVVSYSTFDEADASSIDANLHSVNSLGGGAAFAYDLGLSYLDVGSETGHEIRAGGDYYFNNAFSVGASIELESIGDFDSSYTTLEATYFVAPSIELSAAFVTAGQDADGDAILLAGAVRF